MGLQKEQRLCVICQVLLVLPFMLCFAFVISNLNYVRMSVNRSKKKASYCFLVAICVYARAVRIMRNWMLVLCVGG
jgi:hypothetical protein